MSEYICVLHDSAACNECVKQMQSLESRLRLAEELARAISSSLNILGEGKCKEHNCGGCEIERNEAVAELKEALAAWERGSE